MNKIIYIFIVSSLFLMSGSTMFAEVVTNIPCSFHFSSSPIQLVDNYAYAAYQDLEVSTLTIQERNAERRIRDMYQDLINYYSGKILEITAPGKMINLIHFPTTNNTLITLEYLPIVTSKIYLAFDEFVTNQFSVSKKQRGISTLPQYSYKDKDDESEDRMGIGEYLLTFLQKQLRYLPSSDDDINKLIEKIQNPYEDPIFPLSKRVKKLLQIDDTDILKNQKNQIINNDLLTPNSKKYLKILLQHILTYHIFTNELYQSADSDLRTRMLAETYYTIVTGETTTSYQYEYVRFNDFIQNIMNNVKYILEHQKRSYNEIIFKDTTLSFERQEQLAREVYPNVFFDKKEFLSKLGSTVLEQDMLFLIKYINVSSKKEEILQFINQYSKKTSVESGIFDTFNLYVKKHPEISVFNLKQTFYIKGFPIYLDRLVKALLKQQTIHLSNKDIMDLILSLYDTSVQELGISYEEAAKKFGLVARNDSDNTTSLYFSGKKSYYYQEHFYTILLYLIDNDKDFCKDMLLLNDDIIHSLRETLILDKIYPDSLY